MHSGQICRSWKGEMVSFGWFISSYKIWRLSDIGTSFLRFETCSGRQEWQMVEYHLGRIHQKPYQKGYCNHVRHFRGPDNQHQRNTKWNIAMLDRGSHSTSQHVYITVEKKICFWYWTQCKRRRNTNGLMKEQITFDLYLCYFWIFFFFVHNINRHSRFTVHHNIFFKNNYFWKIVLKNSQPMLIWASFLYSY